MPCCSIWTPPERVASAVESQGYCSAMIFSSLEFLVFFAIYFVAHALTPFSWRLGLIVVGSTIFYGFWDPSLTWIPYLLIFVGYVGCIGMDAHIGATRKFRLAITISLLLAPLVIFKYQSFFIRDILSPVTGMAIPYQDLPLPLGISFITFTMIAYAVDVYRNKYPAERSPLHLAAYVLYFPQLIAGPILRPAQLIPQLRMPRRWQDARFKLGLFIFGVGLLKKVVFADTIADYVDPVFSGEGIHNAEHYLIAIYGFSVQIYCDFSGYTDMAIGLGFMLGVRFPTNFKRPYQAFSLIDFWRRWHITLSYWLRDYLYIPLGGNRRGRMRIFINIFITMTLGGLWHGANWTFIFWGAFHGLGLIVNHFIRSQPVLSALFNLPKWMKVALIFNFVTVGWVFFRAPDMATALDILAGPFVAPFGALSVMIDQLIYPAVLILIFLATHGLDRHSRMSVFVKRAHPFVLVQLLLIVFAAAVILSGSTTQKFIYFNF